MGSLVKYIGKLICYISHGPTGNIIYSDGSGVLNLVCVCVCVCVCVGEGGVLKPSGVW